MRDSSCHGSVLVILVISPPKFCHGTILVILVISFCHGTILVILVFSFCHGTITTYTILVFVTLLGSLHNTIIRYLSFPEEATGRMEVTFLGKDCMVRMRRSAIRKLGNDVFQMSVASGKVMGLPNQFPPRSEMALCCPGATPF